MYKKICLFVFNMILFSCNNEKKIYNENLDNFKALIHDINTYFNDSISNDLQISDYYTDDFVFYSYPVGYRKGIETPKKDYIHNFRQMKEMNTSISIVHSIYLPGINEHSHEVDGSVRVYYGAIISIDTNSVEFSGYQTVDFKEGKIAAIWEWADYGGVSSQIDSFLD